MHRFLFIAQRLSAVLLAPLVMVHLVVILLAVANGLTGEEILSRTQDNIYWGLFYSLFVVTVALHAPIGLRNILREWTPMKNPHINAISILFAVFTLIAGIRAVIAVY